MKHFISIFILSLLLVIKGVAQDTIYNAPYTSYKYNKITNSADGTQYVFHNGIIEEKQIHSILSITGDSEIMQLNDKSKRANNLKFIGFAAVPTGVFAIDYLLKESSVVNEISNNPNGLPTGSQRNLKNKYLGISLACFTATFTCAVLSGVAAERHRKYLTEAIRLYNQSH